MEIYARMSLSCASGTRWRGRGRCHLTLPELAWTLSGYSLGFSGKMAFPGVTNHSIGKTDKRLRQKPV